MIVTNVAEGRISVSSLLSATSYFMNSGEWSRHLLGHSQGLSTVMIPLLPLFKMCVSSRLCSSIKDPGTGFPTFPCYFTRAW